LNIHETASMVSGRGRGRAESEFETAHMINREIAVNEASSSNLWVSSGDTGEEFWIS
jgi:hypothetical protein